MKKPIALVDMDGTLCDFHGSMSRDLLSLRSPGEAVTEETDENKWPDHIRARYDMIKRQPDWWFNLPLIDSGLEIMKLMESIGYKTHVLTRAPRKNFSAWEQKVRWCHKYIPHAEVTITPRKGMVRGAVLFDDYPDYITPWVNQWHRGLVIMPDQPWNRYFSHPQVLRYVVGKNEEEVKLKLVERYLEFKKEHS